MTPAADHRPDDLVWYAAYGSNLNRDRFTCYVEGGRPVGGSRRYPGCRDGSAPLADRPVRAAGGLHFAGTSSVWGGGLAFVDPDADDVVLLRAYLVTGGQFLDIIAQEMRREIAEPAWRETDFGCDTVTEWTLGAGHYETVYRLGDLDERPLLTISHGRGNRPRPPNPPAKPYLRQLSSGLRQAHGLQAPAAADYLSRCPGIGWAPAELARLSGP